MRKHEKYASRDFSKGLTMTEPTHKNRKELLTIIYQKLPTYTEIAESNRPVLQKWLRDFNEYIEQELKFYE